MGLTNQKVISSTPEKVNNDIDIFEGLTACSDMENLKIYYKQNYKHVTDKKGFEELKDKLKATMIQ